MQAQEKTLIEFLRDKQQFTIPIYQRTYSWTSKQCLKLWEDIKEISNSDKTEYHFVGSIVRLKRKLDSSEISEQVIIDGQQRVTTILLLLSAIIQSNINKERAEELKEDFLINKHGKGDLRYKMMLTQEDRPSLINLIDNRLNDEITSKRIKENFEFFKEEIAKENPEKIYAGVRKLMIVDICLDPKYDNPQLIFESLNSTGLELSQADLIRNFILMGLEQKHQEDLYYNYWHVMEKDFGQANYSVLFDRFMRDYLTIKNRNIPNIKSVYETFKNYFFKNGGINNVDVIIKDIHKFSQFYTRIALEKETNKKLKQAFADLNDLKVDVAYPFLLNIYDDFVQNVIDEEVFLEILNLIQSYVFRRFVCGIPTNSLNKTFANLYESINKDDYLNSLKAQMALMENYRKFPNDDEFMKELKEKDLYNIRNRNFWLRRFENFGRKEFVRVEDYTIEHIMPQNPNLSEEWKRELGSDFKRIQDSYLHTIGNLTLTGYNSELSDKPFARKKSIEGGFDQSPIRLNRSLAKFSVWDEQSINERAKMLADEMIRIWPYPAVEEEVLSKYRNDKKADEKIYTIEDHSFLTDGPMKELFDTFRKRVLNIDSSVKEEFLKLYVAYKATTNFVDVVPQKSKLRISLNMDFDEIYDPKNLCIDVRDKGRWGNGDVEIYLNSIDQLDDAMLLIKQSFDKNSENSLSF